jgi:hypothetical protein
VPGDSSMPDVGNGGGRTVRGTTLCRPWPPTLDASAQSSPWEELFGVLFCVLFERGQRLGPTSPFAFVGVVSSAGQGGGSFGAGAYGLVASLLLVHTATVQESGRSRIVCCLLVGGAWSYDLGLPMLAPRARRLPMTAWLEARRRAGTMSDIQASSGRPHAFLPNSRQKGVGSTAATVGSAAIACASRRRLRRNL